MNNGFKQCEIGAIPEDWAVTPLDQVARTVDSLHVTPSFSEVGYPMVRVTDIKPGNLKLEGALKVSKVVFDEFIRNYKPKRNDIVLARVGSYGVSSFVDTDDSFCMGQNTVVIEAKVPPRFLYYVLNSSYTRKQIEDGSYGSGYKSLSLKNIKELLVPIPNTIKEQSAIAEALTDLDKLLSESEKLIAKKRDIKQATMQQLLTGKTRLSGFKADWITLKLDSIIDVLTDYTANGSFESLKNNVQYFENQNYAALVRTTDLGKRKFEPARFTDKKGYNFLSKTALYGGELILANVGSIGKVFRVPHFDMPMTLAPNTYLIKFTSNIDQEFMCQYLNTDLFYKKLMSQVGSSTLQAINKQNLRNIEILIPSVRDEQETISKLLVSMDLDLEASIRKWEKLKLFKQGMMQELLTGRIRLV